VSYSSRGGPQLFALRGRPRAARPGTPANPRLRCCAHEEASSSRGVLPTSLERWNEIPRRPRGPSEKRRRARAAGVRARRAVANERTRSSSDPVECGTRGGSATDRTVVIDPNDEQAHATGRRPKQDPGRRAWDDLRPAERRATAVVCAARGTRPRLRSQLSDVELRARASSRGGPSGTSRIRTCRDDVLTPARDGRRLGSTTGNMTTSFDRAPRRRSRSGWLRDHGEASDDQALARSTD